MNKIKVLFQSWHQVQHSYGIVMCFLLFHLHKNYKNEIDIYIEEMPYFNKKWNDTKKNIYNNDYNKVLSLFKVYNNESVDLIWRQTYPYNITVIDSNIPMIVFYTSEFSKLDPSYFNIDNVKMLDDVIIKKHLEDNKQIHFTTPSKWSSTGLNDYCNRDCIITHGVDCNIFYNKNDNVTRNKIREKYNIKDSDILLINIGAMTGNKGILLILQAMHHLINVLGKYEYKLLLKGSNDLYTSREFLENYLNQLENVISKQHSERLQSHIIFITDTIQFKTLNDLYNACDLYVSPYICEGFNLTVLEALSAGLNVLIPKTGSTREYISDIYNNSGNEFIHYIQSTIIECSNGFCNKINMNSFLDTLINFKKGKNGYIEMVDYIKNNYSWDTVSKLVYNYIKKIKND
jgi:glycosyltransferase involved in cell wall biosynthesis